MFSPTRFAMTFCGFLCCCGCSETPEIREYTLESDGADHVLTDKFSGDFPQIPFRWKAPADWRNAANDRFSVVAWTVGPENPLDEGRITLTGLSSGTAGLMAQIGRWADQIGFTYSSESDLMTHISELTVGDDRGVRVRLKGPKESIHGAILIVSGRMWLFKFRASNETAKQHGDAFDKFIQSMESTAKKDGD